MLTGVVLYPVAAAAAALYTWRAAAGQPAFVVAMRALFVLYLGWVGGAALFPLPVSVVAIATEAAGRRVSVHLFPLASIRDVLLNFVGILLGFAVYTALRGAVSTPDIQSGRQHQLHVR